MVNLLDDSGKKIENSDKNNEQGTNFVEKDKELLENFSLMNPVVKGSIDFGGKKVLLIKHKKEYKGISYTCYSLCYEGKLYDINKGNAVNDSYIVGKFKNEVIVRYTDGRGRHLNEKFNGDTVEKIPYFVDAIKDLGGGEQAIFGSIENDDGEYECFVEYDGYTSPVFGVIDFATIFDGKLTVVGRVDGEVLVSVGDKIYGKGEGWCDVELNNGGGHTAPIIQWTKMGNFVVK